jgi:hypothetical protein
MANFFLQCKELLLKVVDIGALLCIRVDVHSSVTFSDLTQTNLELKALKGSQELSK